MGWSCSWIAVRGKEGDALLEEMGLRRSGGREALPGSPWTAATLPGGWFLVFCAKDCEPPAFEAAALSALSAGCELLHSSVEEHVMCSSAACWSDGGKAWEVLHDAQRGIFDLRASGSLPEGFETLRLEALSRQREEGGEEAEVDHLFDVPLTLAAERTGFRHDGDFPSDEAEPFRVLAPEGGGRSTAPGKKPWWRPW